MLRNLESFASFDCLVLGTLHPREDLETRKPCHYDILCVKVTMRRSEDREDKETETRINPKSRQPQLLGSHTPSRANIPEYSE